MGSTVECKVTVWKNVKTGEVIIMGKYEQLRDKVHIPRSIEVANWWIFGFET